MCIDPNPHCPHCNELLVDFEAYDTEWYDNRYYDKVSARCPKCNRNYHWIDVYILDHIEDFTEEKEGD